MTKILHGLVLATIVFLLSQVWDVLRNGEPPYTSPLTIWDMGPANDSPALYHDPL